MRKLNSTNSRNLEGITRRCGLAYTLERIGGRWKAVILWRLLDKPYGYNELAASIPGITQRMLAKQLQELVRDALVRKHVISRRPLRTEYTVTDLGSSLRPHLEGLSQWGYANRTD